jgi:ribonuclease-3
VIDDFAGLEHALGVAFRDRKLLQQAFVHRSYLNENPSFPLGSNERLEFLGDAVLGFVAAEYLYREFPQLPEGELTGLRAALVRAETLALVARQLGLGDHLRLGRGEASTGGRERQTILSQTLEAFIGAVFIDQGLRVAKRFVLSFLGRELKRVREEKLVKDFKSQVQELVQAKLQVTPAYRTVSATGPDHDKIFTVEVLAGSKVLGQGSGHNKQEAQQNAAKHALETWTE